MTGSKSNRYLPGGDWEWGQRQHLDYGEEGAHGPGGITEEQAADIGDLVHADWLRAEIRWMDIALRDIRKAITESRTQPERVWSIGDILDTAGY
jgi:hypothetical protein